jgi:hypothetical protein
LHLRHSRRVVFVAVVTLCRSVRGSEWVYFLEQCRQINNKLIELNVGVSETLIVRKRVIVWIEPSNEFWFHFYFPADRKILLHM